jgi:hypothetical protein
VALSVTSGGGNSLVGVAIAAALLPPVVNTGICLTFSFIAEQSYDDDFDSAHFLKVCRPIAYKHTRWIFSFVRVHAAEVVRLRAYSSYILRKVTLYHER